MSGTATVYLAHEYEPDPTQAAFVTLDHHGAP